MDCKLGINLGWSRHNTPEQIHSEYSNWFSQCEKQGFQITRIFLTRWSLNTLFEVEYIQCLKDILKLAEKHKLEVILVLNTFTDFITDYEIHMENEEFTWCTYPLKTNHVDQFFQKIDQRLLSAITNLLNSIQNCPSVQKIEVFNEPDLVPVSVPTWSKWLKLLHQQLSIFEKRYTFQISLAHWAPSIILAQEKQQNLETSIHSYAFPSHFGFLNMEYVNNKLGNRIISETSRYSDAAHINDTETIKYFCSSLWGAHLYNHQAILFWWWEEILNNKQYLNVITIFNKYFRKTAQLNTKTHIIIKESLKAKRQKTKRLQKKAFSRLKDLVQNPWKIYNELNPILKFLNQLIHRFLSPTILFRSFENENETIFYLETADNYSLNIDIHISLYIKSSTALLIDLINGTEESIKVLNRQNASIIENLTLSNCHLIIFPKNAIKT